MKLEDLKKKEDKTNMSMRVTKKYRDEVTKFCDDNEINVAEFMRYAVTKVMKDEK